MAEAGLESYAWVIFTGIIFAGILNKLRKNRITKKVNENNSIEKTIYSALEKKNFKIGALIGAALGFLVYLQHFSIIFGIQPPWFTPFIQLYPVVLYLTLLFTYTIFQFLGRFTKIPFFEKNKGRVDGIFASFTIIQIIVFIRFPLEFFPTAK